MSEINVNLIKLAGLVYGDGYITKRGEISFHHSIEQKEYILYKQRLLESYGLKSRISKINNISGFSKNKGLIVSSTITSFSKKIRSDWYINNKKNIPCNLLEEFGWEEWAILFQDDGRCNKISHYNTIKNGSRVKVEVEPYVNRYEICLGFPSTEEITSLINSLKKLGIHSSVLTRKDGQRNISISRAESKILFYEKIKPYVIPSMQYKIRIRPTLSYTS